MTVADAKLDLGDIDALAEERIVAAQLQPGLHPFYLAAKQVSNVSPQDALAISSQFQAMTRTFMYTTISGLGAMARGFAVSGEPDHDELAMFQTAYKVIGDDLANLDPMFGEVAPTGPAGIHYIWWKETIRDPLAACVDEATEARAEEHPPELQTLIANMARLAEHPLGASVQLRVVEAIAKDVAIALRRLLAKVTHNGEAVFESANLVWLDAHIRAESMHARQVSDDEAGMSLVVKSVDEGKLFVDLVDEYATNWSRSLSVYTSHLHAA